MKVTVTTYVTGGELQPAAFGVEVLPSHTVLVSDSAPTDFTAIAGRVIQGERVYKVHQATLALLQALNTMS